MPGLHHHKDRLGARINLTRTRADDTPSEDLSLVERSRFTSNDWIAYYQSQKLLTTLYPHQREQRGLVIDRVMIAMMKGLYVLLGVMTVSYACLLAVIFWAR